jgi:hypothetical protein
MFALLSFAIDLSLTPLGLPSFSLVATLGMVEFFIFLLHKYYEDLDIAKEQVFANVHFTLFYTAVLNAFQSVILAFLTMRISHRMWVQTETLELNHYVEIREEFELVSAQLEQLKYKPGSGSSTSGETPEVEDEQHPKSSKQPAKIAGGGDSEFVFEFSIKGVRKLFGRLLDRIKYPRIKSKHDQLLVQIRFHELRVHFLQAYKLPLKLRISDYLIRSEQQVLIKLVHVSTVSWLLLLFGNRRLQNRGWRNRWDSNDLDLLLVLANVPSACLFGVQQDEIDL